MEQHVEGHPPGHPFCRMVPQLGGMEDRAARGERLARQADEADARGDHAAAKFIRNLAAKSLVRAMRDADGVKPFPGQR